MSSFRKDPFGPAWVLISPERGLEASDFGSVDARRGRTISLADDGPHAPRELAALRPSGAARAAWRARVVEHPFALLGEAAFAPAGAEPFVHAPSHGYQEVVVEHRDPDARIDAFPSDHLVDVLRLYRERLQVLADRPHVRHVQVTRSVGVAAGTLFDGPHGVVLAAPVPNRWVEEERSAGHAHLERTGTCLFCTVLEAERRRKERLIASNERYLAIAPYASKTPFETWILPRQHRSAFAEEPANDLPYLADLLQSLLRTMNAALDTPPYNLLLHTSPAGGDAGYHWHLELLPRLTRQSGFDWGNGFYVNPTPPEDAARFLREGMAMQEVT